jgi:hypothetical protein
MKLLKQLLPSLIAYVAIVVYFTIAIGNIQSGKEFNVRHSPAVEQTVNADGTHTAGSPEIYHVDISKSLAWELHKGYSKPFIAVGKIMLALLSMLFLLAAFEKLPPSFPFNLVVFAWLAVIMALLLAAFSSAYTSNFLELSPQDYEYNKDNLGELFRNKANFIR